MKSLRDRFRESDNKKPKVQKIGIAIFALLYGLILTDAYTSRPDVFPTLLGAGVVLGVVLFIKSANAKSV